MPGLFTHGWAIVAAVAETEPAARSLDALLPPRAVVASVHERTPAQPKVPRLLPLLAGLSC